MNDDDVIKDPKHPMNNPKLISEVHFVGRNATDSSIIELATLLMNNDTYGSITELWLNNNLISDDGASALASYLQSPTCALIELWLGDNQIGPVGTALISAALESNTKLKCFGLYNNPIGNGGAMTLAQMLRKNHRLTTVDVHGCGRRGSSTDVIEGYGCKVIKARDGKEYVARVVAHLTEEDEGIVTDQRLLDVIQTYAAFNRINPTREQVVRGFTDSKKPGSHDDVTTSEGNDSGEGKKHTIVSKFLSELGSRPANEILTDAEKQTWKDCEWDRLYVEIERARAAKVALATEIKADIINEREGLLVNYGGVGEKNDGEIHRLDDEVVYTDSRSWRNVTMSITGTAEPTHRQSSNAPADSITVDVESESFTASGDSVDEADSQQDRIPVPGESMNNEANIGIADKLTAEEVKLVRRGAC